MSEGSAVERLVPRSADDVPSGADARQAAWRRLGRRTGARINWPLAAVLAVQAGLSLVLVWTNSAYFDEAEHILDGKLEWANLLHGAPLPTYTEAGARQIYPLIGALASDVGGLVAARILSLCFMLVATLLLYQTGVRLFGRTAALAAVALWAVSEPVLRLAFATWDPLACLLVITSLRLAVQAGLARHRTPFVVLSALALALAGVTALPFLIYFPVVVVVALLVWLNQMRARPAIWWTVGLTLGSAAMVAGLLTLFHLWPNVFDLAHYRTLNAHRVGFFGSPSGRATIWRMAWVWSGLIFAVACAGVVTAVAVDRPWKRPVLLAALAAAALAVPLYQIHISAAIGLDKQMSARRALVRPGHVPVVARHHRPDGHAQAAGNSQPASADGLLLRHTRALLPGWQRGTLAGLQPAGADVDEPAVPGHQVGCVRRHSGPAAPDEARGTGHRAIYRCTDHAEHEGSAAHARLAAGTGHQPQPLLQAHGCRPVHD
jgi:hypothetical protein